MKSYSFVRENVYKVFYPWSKDDTTGGHGGDLKTRGRRWWEGEEEVGMRREGEMEVVGKGKRR